MMEREPEAVAPASTTEYDADNQTLCGLAVELENPPFNCLVCGERLFRPVRNLRDGGRRMACIGCGSPVDEGSR
jgi:predicted RNA-binding Zn-ribbon protein involved in translation (DUF1610 family)